MQGLELVKKGYIRCIKEGCTYGTFSPRKAGVYQLEEFSLLVRKREAGGYRARIE